MPVPTIDELSTEFPMGGTLPTLDEIYGRMPERMPEHLKMRRSERLLEELTGRT